MIDKKQSRLRRARATRVRIALQGFHRLTVFRSNLHIYASVVSPAGDKVLVSASTAEPEVRALLGAQDKGGQGKGGNVAAAKLVGTRLAQKAKAAGIETVAFDRAGFRFHGRVKALADAAREAGLKL
jgi:large subunit ribosomal protein L18